MKINTSHLTAESNKEGNIEKELQKSKILVIIPAHNEEDNIAHTIKEIKEKASYVDILVVNDGSSDRTSEIAMNNGVKVANQPFNMGIGAAVQTGFKIASEEGYDIAIQIDADGQHNPLYIPKLCEQILHGDADIVIGSRYKEKSEYRASRVRLSGIKFFSWLTSLIIKQKITDTTSGLRALNKDAYALFSEEYPTDFPDAEAIILLGYRGFRIIEIPIEMRNRSGGISFFSVPKLLYYPFKNLLAIVCTVLREYKNNPLHANIFPDRDDLAKTLDPKDIFLWEYYGRGLLGRLHSWIFRTRYKIIVNSLTRSNTKVQTILDAGCGPMIISYAWVKKFDAEYIGIDVLPQKKLEQYRRAITQCTGKPINVIRASVEKLPFKDDSFDCSISLDVLEHLEKSKEAINEIIRVTKHDGTIVVSLPLENAFQRLARIGFILMGKKVVLKRTPEYHYVGDLHSYAEMMKYIKTYMKIITTKYTPIGFIKALNINAIHIFRKRKV